MAVAEYVKGADGFYYQLSIVDNGDGTFSEQYTRVELSTPPPVSASDFLNVAAVVTKAMSKFADNSAEFRAKFVTWFNEIARDVFSQPRRWAFLIEPVDVAVINNQIVLPSGVSTVETFSVNGVLLTAADQISELQAVEYSIQSAFPEKYTYSGGVVTFYPSASGNCVVTYQTSVNANYTDVETDTIFPYEFENLFITGLRMHGYDYDKDGRYSKEVQLYQYAMSQMKAWDNRHKATPTFNRKGYIRARY